MSDLKLVLVKDIKSMLNKPLFVVGFPGIGLVGSIATTYLSKSSDFEMVGYFRSSKLAPLAAIHSYVPLPPIRLMASKKQNMLVLISEISIPMQLSDPFAEIILQLYKDLRASYLVLMGGINLNSNTNVYFVPSNNTVKKMAIDNVVGKLIKDGAVTGVTALLLTLSKVNNYNTIALLGEANPDYGDPRATSNVIKAFNKLFKKSFNTKQLDKEAEELKKELSEMNSKSDSFSPSMYG